MTDFIIFHSESFDSESDSNVKEAESEQLVKEM